MTITRSRRRKKKLRWDDQTELDEEKYYTVKILQTLTFDEDLPSHPEAFSSYMHQQSCKLAKISMTPTADLSQWALSCKDVDGAETHSEQAFVKRAHENSHGLVMLDRVIAIAMLENESYRKHPIFGHMFTQYFLWCENQLYTPTLPTASRDPVKRLSMKP